MDIINTLRTSPASPGITILGLCAAGALYTLLNRVYLVYFGPLSKYAGPKLWAWTDFPSIWWEWQGRNHEIMEKLHKKYGPVVRIGLKQVQYIGPEAWKDINGHKREGQPKAFRDPFDYGHGNESIITADDPNHTRIRRILNPAFSERSIRDSEPLLKKWAAKLQQKMTEKAQTGEETDVLKIYNCTTFDLMGDLTFSENLGMLDNSEYSPWVKAIFEGIKTGTFFVCLKKIHWTMAFIVDKVLINSAAADSANKEHEHYSNSRVDRRLQRTPETPDLWTKILDKSETIQTLTMKEHYTTANIFMIAGTETSATALSGMTYYLLRNPSSMSRLVKEIRTAFTPGKEDEIHLDSLARLKYLSAVIQEGLRLYPPVPGALSRRTPKGGMMICGGFVPGDTAVGVHQMATCRSERYFALPDEFHPERWLVGEDERFKDDRLNANEPFSTGPRNCIGKTLAYHEMRLLLTTVILNFDLELCEASENWNDQKMYFLWEKKPLICKLKLVEGSK